MKRLKKILIWFFVIFVVFVIGLYITAALSVSKFKPDLEKILTEEIGFKTKINGSLSVKLLPGISFVINDLRVINNETYLVRIDRAEIAVNFQKLFSSNIEITGLTLLKPQVFVEYNADGSYNFDRPNDTQKKPGTKKNNNQMINLQKVSVGKGTLIYFDNEHGDSLFVKGIRVVSDKVNFSGSLEKLKMKNLLFSGTFDIQSFKFNDLQMDSLQWKVVNRSGKLSIQTLSGHHFKGKSNMKTLIDLNRKPADVTIKSQITGMDIGEFRESAHVADVFFGNLNYDINISFKSFNWTRALNTLNGTINIDGGKLLVQGISVDSIAKTYKESKTFNVAEMATLFLAGPYRSVFAKNIHFARSSGDGDVSMGIERIVSKWTISNGIARAQDVAFRTKKYRFAMTGELDLADENYKDMTISLLNQFGCPALSLQMNGPLSAPDEKIISHLKPKNIDLSLFPADLANSTRNYCEPIYSGSLKHPAVH